MEPLDLEYEETCSNFLYDAGENGISMGQYVIQSNNDLIDFTTKSNEWCWVELNHEELTHILIIDEIHGDKAHDISISRVSETIDQIIVTYSYIVNHGAFPEVMNQPYTLISIPKTTKKVIFEEL